MQKRRVWRGKDGRRGERRTERREESYKYTEVMNWEKIERKKIIWRAGIIGKENVREREETMN